jgi:hypothetical protein
VIAGDVIESRLDEIQTAIDRIESTINLVEATVDPVEANIDTIQAALDCVQPDIYPIQSRVHPVQAHFDSIDPRGRCHEPVGDELHLVARLLVKNRETLQGLVESTLPRRRHAHLPSNATTLSSSYGEQRSQAECRSIFLRIGQSAAARWQKPRPTAH